MEVTISTTDVVAVDESTEDGERCAPGAAIRVASPAALRAERTFAMLVAVVPATGTLAALAWLWARGAGWSDLAVFVIMYLVTGFGITVGYHRLFTHRSFDCPAWVRAAFAIAGSMALQGPVIRWVADHRRHHAFSDRPGDPHSPHRRATSGVIDGARELWHAHVGWFFGAEKTRIKKFAPDLLADSALGSIDRRYLVWVALSLAMPFGLGWALGGSWLTGLSGLLWGGFVRLLLVHHVTWSINSICHYFGRRPYETRDLSTNNAWLAVVSLGESWHNNHHAFPTAAVHGVDRLQIDPSGLLIRTLVGLGLASNLKRPTAAQLASRRVAP